MRKGIIFSLMMLLCVFALSACSSDIHYDSISTEITFNIPDLKNDGESFKIHQRFQFDRDLIPLRSMTLEEAWISSPVSDKWDEESLARVDNAYSLNVIKSINIYIVKSENEPPIYWLLVSPSQLVGKHALFSAFTVGSSTYGDLRDYMDNYQQLEIEIELALEPYEASRYWRDVCGMSETCIMKLPLSMQFKMED